MVEREVGRPRASGSAKPWLTLILAGLLSAVISCEPTVRNRPYGYLRLGALADLSAPETVVPEAGVVVRRDSRGFFAMSTLCTHDLTQLVLDEGADGQRKWRSRSSTSSYSFDGDVLSGPAVQRLPYFELQLQSGTYGGPKDTLYVIVGSEKPPSWRLSIGPR